MLLLTRLAKPGCCSPTTSPRVAHAALGWNRFFHTGDAHNVFGAMPAPDHRQCSELLRARTASGDHYGSVCLVRGMLGRDLRPDRLALAAAIKSASALPDSGALGSCLHGFVVRLGNAAGVAVAKAIMDMYGRRGALTDARLVFDEMGCPDACDRFDDALHSFADILDKDSVSWNAILSGCANRKEHIEEFAKLFCEMCRKLQCPDTVGITNILLACIHLSSVQLVKQCHSYMLRASLEDIHLEGALLDAYSKCGNITNAYNLFRVSPNKDLVTFTAMIGGYAMHGMAEEAVELFYEMLTLDIKPDHVALTALLSACSHAGLVDAGIKVFKFARDIYRVEPTAEHYTCMVDLLARGGRLQDAYSFVLDMPPHMANANVWGSLLGACKVHGEIRIGQLAADHLFSMEAGDIGNYIIVSNIYAADEKWDGVEHVRKLMKSKDMKKPAGCSQALVYSQ
nr:putative pentatricopeptide repeat-containing protein At5g08490 [Aegilops tauschii subsp. strangulata]